MIQSYGEPIQLYRCETWTIALQIQAKIGGFKDNMGSEKTNAEAMEEEGEMRSLVNKSAKAKKPTSFLYLDSLAAWMNIGKGRGYNISNKGSRSLEGHGRQHYGARHPIIIS